jgi:hypothetical protein
MKKESSFDAQESIEHVEVSVRTPGGTWPTEGFFIVPAAQRIVLQLEHTAKSLKLENRQGWAASVDGKRLDPTRSYRENSLSGRVCIDYGPVS